MRKMPARHINHKKNNYDNDEDDNKNHHHHTSINDTRMPSRRSCGVRLGVFVLSRWGPGVFRRLTALVFWLEGFRLGALGSGRVHSGLGVKEDATTAATTIMVAHNKHHPTTDIPRSEHHCKCL